MPNRGNQGEGDGDGDGDGDSPFLPVRIVSLDRHAVIDRIEYAL